METKETEKIQNKEDNEEEDTELEKEFEIITSRLFYSRFSI